MTYLRDAALDLGMDHWPIPPYSRFNLAEQAIGSFKSTVTACLLGASAEDGPINASYVQSMRRSMLRTCMSDLCRSVGTMTR